MQFFVGQGSYRLSSATETERKHLALASGADRQGFETLTEFDKNQVVRVGQLPILGETTLPVDVKLKLPKKPRRVLINAHGEVLARD